MKTVKHLLDTKQVRIISVPENISVLDALKVMTEKNISAVLVMEDQMLRGIFTERDYARKIILQGKSSKDTLINEAMTATPITITLNDSIDFCMELMTDKHIRHLPIVVDGEVKGMVSIGDVVKFIIEDQKQTISQLESYISG
ncbi:CBS domain-containing protein [Pedobacter sp. HDW13]|uniref:CBS domain-containing protein n=1 Tax=unclassified Pedobacter TaxID=2628915 RepID=UPI000F59BF5B|nr:MULTISPECIES: CBS domain-containing protein [unclassified Pedobacter]QIL40130.1 CBS domain-containing protein [Pedobacter sp. HDW13]RQO68373.1 histidine kinase [Pedobacter sp. KBW01]